MLEERRILDQIEVRTNGVIFIKELNQVLRDGEVISSIPHRSSVAPLNVDGSETDLSMWSYDMLKNVATVVWTEDIKESFRQSLQAAQPASE